MPIVVCRNLGGIDFYSYHDFVSERNLPGMFTWFPAPIPPRVLKLFAVLRPLLPLYCHGGAVHIIIIVVAIMVIVIVMVVVAITIHQLSPPSPPIVPMLELECILPFIFLHPLQKLWLLP